MPPVPREEPAEETARVRDMVVGEEERSREGMGSGWESGGTIGFESVNVVDYLDGLGVGVCARILGVETVDVGHKEEVVGVDHGGGDGGEGVVVAEFDF